MPRERPCEGWLPSSQDSVTEIIARQKPGACFTVPNADQKHPNRKVRFGRTGASTPSVMVTHANFEELDIKFGLCVDRTKVSLAVKLQVV